MMMISESKRLKSTEQRQRYQRLKTRQKPGCYVHIADFANMVKAFIGSNYLSVAFAFSQSGLLLGTFGLVFIACLTDYCCHLIVRTKYHCIEKMIKIHRSSSAVNEEVKKDESSDYSTDIVVSSSPADGDHNSTSDGDTSDREEIIYEIDHELFLRQHMMKHMTYGDVGKISMGNFGLVIVNICIAITQFGFCVAYFIFIGNTIYSLFPILCYNGTINDSYVGNVSRCKIDQLTMQVVGVDDSIFKRSLENETAIDAFTTLLNMSIIKSDFTLNHEKNNTSPFIDSFVTNSVVSSKSMNEVSIVQGETTDFNTGLFTSTELDPETSVVPSKTTTAYADSSYWSVTNDTEDNGIFKAKSQLENYISSAPNLKLLVIAPLPVFILFALIRNVRNLGWISITADLAIFIGCVSVMSYILIDFSVADSVIGDNWQGLAIFFGMLTGAFEGIGLVIPIESSMEGNRHHFAAFLHGAVGVLTFVLGGFGILGYMRFGTEVKQMLNTNLPPTTSISLAVNICVCIGVLLTFPLQIYPAIEIAETYMFSDGKICGPKPKPQSNDRVGLLEDEENMDEVDSEVLLPKVPANLPLPVAVHIPDSVATWKRNLLRFILVLIAGGLAVTFRDSFAYVTAFIGAVGSSLLAFILPCLFYVKLCWSDLNIATIVMNMTIVVLGVCCSVVSLYVVIDKLVENTSV